ncbi:hypothetical protein protein, putative [Babesia ovis]|uniref:Uncharacterized protein n=1 Tax=Babesia ovis TaxID=5869 RepID=A0A9W5WV97_BABOV|nr:hypothetical protein protein, putative [Babesia ovis]
MKLLCLVISNLVLLPVTAVSGGASTEFMPIKIHASSDGVAFLEQPITSENKTEEVKAVTKTEENTGESKTEENAVESKNEAKPKVEEPLNLIFNPTAQQVSNESKKLLESMESGLRNLRSSFEFLTHLIHLLPETEKQDKITVEKKEMTFAELLDSFSNYITDGEKQQRVLIQGTAEILHKLAMPHTPPPQNN